MRRRRVDKGSPNNERVLRRRSGPSIRGIAIADRDASTIIKSSTTAARYPTKHTNMTKRFFNPITYLIPFVILAALFYGLEWLVRYKKRQSPTHETAHAVLRDFCTSCGQILDVDDLNTDNHNIWQHQQNWMRSTAHPNHRSVIRLNRDRDCLSPSDGLVVTEGVTLDCQNYILVGRSSNNRNNGNDENDESTTTMIDTSVGIRIRGHGVTIRNCRVEGFTTGLLIEEGATDVLVQSTSVRNARGVGIHIMSNVTMVTLNDVGVTDSLSHNIWVQGNLTLDGVTACGSRQGQDIHMNHSSLNVLETTMTTNADDVRVHLEELPSTSIYPTTTCNTGAGCHAISHGSCDICPAV